MMLKRESGNGKKVRLVEGEQLEEMELAQAPPTPTRPPFPLEMYTSSHVSLHVCTCARLIPSSPPLPTPPSPRQVRLVAEPIWRESQGEMELAQEPLNPVPPSQAPSRPPLSPTVIQVRLVEEAIWREPQEKVELGRLPIYSPPLMPRNPPLCPTFAHPNASSPLPRCAQSKELLGPNSNRKYN
jgi:hypothetical protein